MAGMTDLNALMIFHEVAASGGISAAAGKLNLPKSTISRKLSVLEHQLGTKLLRRDRQRLVLTEFGRGIYDHTQRIVAELEDAGVHRSEQDSRLSGLLRISLPVDFGSTWLSRLVAEFSREHPDIRLMLDINNRRVDLSEEPYDIAIMLSAPGDAQRPARPFSTLSRGMYVAPGYLARRPVPRTPEEILSHAIIITMHQAEEGVWQRALGLGADDRSIEPQVILNNIAMARQMVLAGMGIAILPNVMCRRDLASERLIRICPELEVPPLQAYATFPARRRAQRKTRVFANFLSSFLLTDP